MVILQRLTLLVPLTLLLSCGMLHSPDEILHVEGEYVVVYYHTDSPDAERFVELAAEADQAWLDVLRITGLRITAVPRIFVLETGTGPFDNGWSENYMTENTVQLSSQAFRWSAEDRASLLRHELTHLAVFTHYGLSESFILMEGIAEYVGHAGNYPYMVDPSERGAVVRALPLTIGELLQKYFSGSGTEEGIEISFFYHLAGSFASYIIETYSMEAYLQLYRRFDISRPADSYQEISGQTMEEMYVELFDF